MKGLGDSLYCSLAITNAMKKTFILLLTIVVGLLLPSCGPSLQSTDSGADSMATLEYSSYIATHIDNPEIRIVVYVPYKKNLEDIKRIYADSNYQYRLVGDNVDKALSLNNITFFESGKYGDLYFFHFTVQNLDGGSFQFSTLQRINLRENIIQKFDIGTWIFDLQELLYHDLEVNEGLSLSGVSLDYYGISLKNNTDSNIALKEIHMTLPDINGDTIIQSYDSLDDAISDSRNEKGKKDLVIYARKTRAFKVDYTRCTFNHNNFFLQPLIKYSLDGKEKHVFIDNASEYIAMPDENILFAQASQGTI